MDTKQTPQQLITRSAQATADSVLTARTASISLPIYDWDSQDAYHSFSIFWHTLENWLLLNCIMPDTEDHLHFCSPGNQIPGDACTMDAYGQQSRTESNQGKSFCLPRLNPTGNDTQCQHPCVPWRTQRCFGQAGRGPPRSCCMDQDTDGLLQDDQ